MTDTNYLISLIIIIIIKFMLIYGSTLISDLKNVSTVLNDLLRTYDRYNRPTYGGLHLFSSSI